MHRGYMFRGYGNMFLTWLIPLMLLLLIGLAVYMIFRNKKTSEQVTEEENSQTPNRALDILNERYAKGEIDDEEYQRMKNNLKK